MNRAFAAAAVALCLTACSQSGGSSSSSSPSASPTAQATNPIAFPLYAPSTLISSRSWIQRVGGDAARGQEVIAESPATLDQLTDWIHGLSARPPNGYVVSASGSGMETARRHAQELGVDFQVFTHDVDGKTHALIVVALDPSEFETKAGPVLGWIDKYEMLPKSFREPIDAQARDRTGFTVSQALDVSTPIGAALAAARTLRNSGERGLVLIDAVKN